MTPFEKLQPGPIFFQAGEHAYMLGIDLQDNPYRVSPFKDLWEIGWTRTKEKFEPPVVLRIPFKRPLNRSWNARRAS